MDDLHTIKGGGKKRISKAFFKYLTFGNKDHENATIIDDR
jgi:hypothetical protein